MVIRANFLLVMDVVRLLNGRKSPDAVRRAANSGELPSIRTKNGTRLFDERDVLRWIERRRQQAELATGTDAA